MNASDSLVGTAAAPGDSTSSARPASGAAAFPPSRWQPQQEQASDNQERWLISYADFITLLMALFMTLYALQLAKVKDVEVSQQRSQAAAVDTAARTTAAAAQALQANPSGTLDGLLAGLQRLVDADMIRVAKDARGVEIDINAKILFQSGDARLLGESRSVLTQLVSALKASAGNSILVEGHTDSVPIANGKYESNWELSSARAGAVVRYLVEQGIAPHRLAAMGRADNVPASLGASAEDAAKNRRVTILVLY